MNCSMLLVYGTLRRGFEAQGLMRRLGARYLGKGSVLGRLFDMIEFPGAAKAPGSGSRVVGELYLLRSATRSFLLLDRYEGSCYRRALAEVELENGKRAQAWVYWMKRIPASKHLIKGGDYARRERVLKYEC